MTDQELSELTNAELEECSQMADEIGSAGKQELDQEIKRRVADFQRAMAALWRDGSYAQAEAYAKVMSLDRDETTELAALADNDDVQDMANTNWD